MESKERVTFEQEQREEKDASNALNTPESAVPEVPNSATFDAKKIEHEDSDVSVNQGTQEGRARRRSSSIFGRVLLEMSRTSDSSVLYGRQKEKEALLKCWERCRQEKTQEMVVISGSPGVGKSALCESLRPLVNNEKPRAFYLSGKFAESSHHRKGPFEVFVTTFSSYTHQLLDSGDDELIDRVRNSLENSVEKDREILVQMIPALDQLFVDSSHHSATYRRSAELAGDEVSGFKTQLVGSEMANRLRNAFAKAVAAITSCTPIMLVFDDAQWSDSSSLDILRSLMQFELEMPLLVVATCRTKALEVVPPMTEQQQQSFASSDLTSKSMERKRLFRSMLKEFEEKEAVRVTSIDLSNLLLEHIQLLIADVLKRETEDVLELARIAHTQTHGNVFHLLQFLRLLCEQSIVEYESGKWVWDDARLNSDIGSVDSILGLVVRSIENLPRNVQEALKVASCLGDEVDTSALELVLQTPAAPLLQQASEEGLLAFSSRYGGYRFAHDLIRHAAFSIIPEDEVKEFHLKIGRRLLQNASSFALENNAMLIASLLNIAIELIADSRERYKVADLNLRAGLTALKLPSFPDAARYFRYGTKFLGDDCWQNHYKLSLDLYSYAAEIESANGNSGLVIPFINEVVQHGATLDDKLKAYLALLDSMTQQGDLKEATAVSIDVLSQLGETLPPRASKPASAREFMRVRMRLRGKSDEAILNGPRMTDPRKMQIMEFLIDGFLLGWRSKDPMSVIFALRSVKVTMKHGIHETSAVGFAVYGATLCGLHIDAKAGYRYGKLALAICQLCGSPKVITMTHNIVGGGILHWSQPVAEDLESLDYVGRIGMEAGYVSNACIAKMMGTLYRYDIGRPLPEIEKKVKEALKIARLYRMHSTESSCALLLQTILCYEGRARDPSRLAGTVVDFDESLRSALALNDKTLVLLHYSLAMELAFIHGDVDQAGHFAEACMQQLMGHPSPTFTASKMEIFNALITVAVYRAGKRRSQLLKVAKKHLLRVAKWSKDAPFNFRHWKLLIEAELMSLKRGSKKDSVSTLYAEAFSLASNQNNLLCMALVREKLGDFLHTRGDKNEALVQWNKSADIYNEWGALVKSQKLRSLVDSG